MLALTGRTHAVAPESPPPETTDVPGNHPIAAPGAGADMVVLDTAPHAAEAALPLRAPAISCSFHAARLPLTWPLLGRVLT